MRHLLAISLSTLAACSGAGVQPAGRQGPPTVAEAEAFVAEADRTLKEIALEVDRVLWVNETYITEDTDWLAARANEKVLAVTRNLYDASRRFEGMALPESVQRQLMLLRLGLSAPAPSDPALRRELTEIQTLMNSTYGKGKYCPAAGDCLDLNALVKIMAESRDYDRLQEVWTGWHQISPPMRDKYARFVELASKGAQEIGFANVGELWRSRYDMTPAAFESEQERLWQQVRPFYESLHCYVRKKLHARYGQRVPKSGPIPAHLLGNMWAQEWSNIYDLLEPYPGQASFDINAKLKAQKYDAQKMVKVGEKFFTSLGMPALPPTFWERSLFVKPKDREVICHASAWDIGSSGDVRIKMCTEVNEEDLLTIHHELGHNYYYLHYYKMPILFQQGAHDGFHEGIGDTLALSVTPTYLKELGLLDSVPTHTKGDTNVLMRRALDKIAFLPFGRLVDQWRWEVFDGRVTPATYNEGWWRLRTKYQGVAPPAPRSEAHFDPGAKYHVPSNVPYARYFLAHILQFQFHRALCRAAGHQGPLHTCSIYGSKAAGDKMAAMLALGAAKPWPEALRAISGETQMDASALTEYFAPLQTYLAEATRGETCGW